MKSLWNKNVPSHMVIDSSQPHKHISSSTSQVKRQIAQSYSGYFPFLATTLSMSFAPKII